MINYLIKNKKITIFFQPIISVKDQKIFAYEALTRAYDEDGEIIMPLFLFEQAKKEKLSSELDIYVRSLAIQKFQDYYLEDKTLLLFLNFESSIIDNNISENFIEFVVENKINPSNIVIEIKEDCVKDNSSLQKFVKQYRDSGFIIAIDDFGTGYSSFDRLALIRPDIVKIDRSIIYNVNNNFINAEILNAISRMCHKIGAMVLAEGVEDNKEILTCMKKDIDIFQGFWFSKPKREIDTLMKEDIKKSICLIGDEYKNMIKQHLLKKKSRVIDAENLAQKIVSVIKTTDRINEKIIEKILLKNSNLEAIYIINEESGFQVGETIIESKEKPLYSPTKEGYDHSLKWCYIIAKESSRGDYLSDKYISKASGNMCRTYSVKVTLENIKYIICLDIIE